MIVVKAKKLYDGYTEKRDMYIVIDGDLIIDVTEEKPDAEIQFEGIVTPAFIDGHSHIGMRRHSEPWNEDEVNEQAEIFLPDLNPLDSIYFDDKYFQEAVEFGVLYSCIVPGSGNLLGGKAIVIKNYAKNRKQALIRHIGYKMALGYNPRSTFRQWRGKRYYTRMGIYALFHRKIHEIIKKKKKIEFKKRMRIEALERKRKKGEISEEEFLQHKREIYEVSEIEYSPVDIAIFELLERKKKLKVHVHKEDDVVFLVEIVKKYGFLAMADHLGDIYRVEGFNMLKSANIPIIYGPIDSLAYKTELKHDSYKNVKPLLMSGAKFGLMTDHPVVLARNLFVQLRYFLMYGYPRDKAISIITKETAEILGVNDILGTIEPGKLASLLIWDEDPFYFGSKPIIVIGEGKILYEHKE